MNIIEKVRLIADGEFEVCAKLSVDEITQICRDLRGAKYALDIAEQKLASMENQEPEPYDAGFLNDFGGGNVSWWHDYIRAELDRAHDHYVKQFNVPADKSAVAVPDSLISDIEFVCNAIQNGTAMQVCCGKPAWIECCGSPDVDWPSWATEAMTKLSSVRNSLIEATPSHSQQSADVTIAGSDKKSITAEQYRTLVILARRAMHIAYVWNDHNFQPAHILARETAKSLDIHDLDEANDFLAGLPIRHIEERPLPAHESGQGGKV